jgi:predicted XRE-type DNA-binding protein
MKQADWRSDPLENTPPVRGSGEFLKDRGYPDPVETRIKFELVERIRSTVETKGLRQVDVAKLVSGAGGYGEENSFTQPDVSRILNGNVKGYSVTRLLSILMVLGSNIFIDIVPAAGPGQIVVRDHFHV